jgi:hypothetical protein
MKFEEIKNNPEIISQLRWDLTPQTANLSGYEINNQADLERLNKLLAEKAGYYFYVDVASCQARLALMHNNATGGGNVEYIRDFESPLLEKAVEEIGSITTSGWYPLSKRLEILLKKKLEIQ